MLLTGCGFVLPGQQESTEDAEKETHENNLNQTNPIPTGFGLAYIPEYGFNPYSCTCITNRPIFSLVYEPLFVLGSGFQPEPVLCERFAVSENGKTYVISICEGVTFSDGTALTVMFSASRIITTRLPPWKPQATPTTTGPAFPRWILSSQGTIEFWRST